MTLFRASQSHILAAAIFALGVAFDASAQSIPLPQDSDGDTILNRDDLDADNDGVADNADFAPLNPAIQTAPTGTFRLNVIADTELRGTSAGNSLTNYGSATETQTRNSQRRQLVKFTVPPLGIINAARIGIRSVSENDTLNVHFVPDSSWVENVVTFNTANLTGNQLAGSVAAVTGAYPSCSTKPTTTQ